MLSYLVQFFGVCFMRVFVYFMRLGLGFFGGETWCLCILVYFWGFLCIFCGFGGGVVVLGMGLSGGRLGLGRGRGDGVVVFPPRHSDQLRVVGGAGRFNVACCGRRWGKTCLGLDLLIAEPGGLLDGFPVGWFAPNGKLFDEVWREALVRLDGVIVSKDSHYNRIEVVGGGVLDFWTLHNTDDPGRSRKYSRVVVDEAGMLPSDRFRRQWSGGIRPTLTDLGGEAWFLSTPQGMNFFWELFMRGQSVDPQWVDWVSWQLPTVGNPFIDPLEVEAARVELDDATFRQEFLAEFVQEFGSVFKGGSARFWDEVPSGRSGTGADFAYSLRSGDYTVFLRGVAARGRNLAGNEATLIYVVDCFRERVMPEVWGASLAAGDWPDVFMFSGGQEAQMTQFLARDFGVTVRHQRATVDKLARARPVQAAWNRGEILLPRVAAWREDVEREVLAFTGNPAVDAHDDVVDALAALHYLLARPPIQLF